MGLLLIFPEESLLLNFQYGSSSNPVRIFIKVGSLRGRGEASAACCCLVTGFDLLSLPRGGSDFDCLPPWVRMVSNDDGDNENVLSSAADWRRSSQVFRQVASLGGDVTKSEMMSQGRQSRQVLGFQ